MVSKLWFLVLSLAASLYIPRAAAQTNPPSPNPPQSAFREESSKTGPAQPAKPATLVTPEMRGDILMARKMYREAAEAYKEGPKDSAVLLNKIGISYHQMLELSIAEKYYRRAIKTNPEYSEAINNLGTIYYARKSYRRAVTEYKKALRLNPKAASVWSNLGTGYFASQDYTPAAGAWQ